MDYRIDTVEERASLRSAMEAGRVSRSPVRPEHVAAALDLDPGDFERLTAAGPDAAQIQETLRDDYNLPAGEPLGRALARVGILTPEEGDWLDRSPS